MDGRIDPAALDAVVAALIAQNPGAFVAAVDGDGLFVDLPPSIELQGQHVLRARSGLELVSGAERLTVIDAWDRMKEVGASLAHVKLRDGTPAAMHFVDVRATHGAAFCVMVVHGAVEVVDQLRERTPIPPRNGRIHKSEVAETLWVDEALCAILGYERDELTGMRVIELVHPEDQERAIDN